MSKFAKAIGGAATALLVYAVAELGLDLPAEQVASLEALVTGLVVLLLRNK